MSHASFNNLLQKLQAYKRKYYINGLLKGLIFFFALILSAYLLVAVFEFYGRFSTTVRLIILIAFIGISGAAFVRWIIYPISGLLAIRKQISNEEAAYQIGKFFPSVKDKLINTLQLGKHSNTANSLLAASINQKTKELSVVPFVRAVNLKENRRYAPYAIIPVSAILLLLVFFPQMITQSTQRIINYNKVTENPAPFSFQIRNKKLDAFRNEDFPLQIHISGNSIPENAYIIISGRRSKLKKGDIGDFTYTFRNIQKSESFYLEAAGYSSPEYSLNMLTRPDLKDLEISLAYPAYLRKKPESIRNAGHITVPEGTTARWNFQTTDTEQLTLKFSDSLQPVVLKSIAERFSYGKKLKKSLEYAIELGNKKASGKEKIIYQINVIPDKYPQINVESYPDTLLYQQITLGGSASDDYGLTKLVLFYRKTEQGKEPVKFKTINLATKTGDPSLTFFHTWNIDTLQLQPGENIEYYVQVWDNDGINGHKSSKSQVFNFKLPGQEEIREDISKTSQNTGSKLDKILSQSKELKKEMDRFDKKIKTKQNLDWQDKKSLEELLKKHEELSFDLENIKQQNEELGEKLKKFNEMDPEVLKKMEELQKLMNELLDEETKKLYEELRKLMEQNAEKEDISKMLEELKKKDDFLEKELEKSLEWFKQIQFDQKLDQIKNDLEKQAEEQKKLAEETFRKEKSNEELQKDQQKLNEEFKKLEEDLKELNKINESLENKNQLGEIEEGKEQIQQEQKQASEELNQNQNKKAGNSQKKAGEKMQEMAQKMSEMQAQMDQEQLQENMDDLRDILENLITLSFDQESLMKDFRKVHQSDPRYIDLSQQQLKLMDDSKIIEDSLMALAKRVFQIQSFITRELGEMNEHMETSAHHIKSRRPDLATGNQQFAMTSMNNLALLLNDVLKQMQQEMSNMSGGGKMCNKPKPGNKPGLGDLQKQLNKQLQQMKQGGKSGEGMSKEIAKMAAQQEMIRKALKELEKKPGGDKLGKELSELMKEMEQSEKDLVNKRISQQLIERQKEILTRLLEAEKSLKEREEDQKRESNTGKNIKRDVPPDFEKYLKEKEKQIELLKTVDPSLTPYYKKEVNEYFDKIEK